MAHAAREQELDADGLVIQKYHSRVLVVVPPLDFGDQILRYARSCLYNVHVGSVTVSPVSETPIKGRLQDEFLVDARLEEADMAAYSGILIAGCDGANPLAQEARVLELLRAAHGDRKLVAAWGNALEVLVRAGVVKGRAVTGEPSLRPAVKAAGGKFTGRQVEVDGHVITARDEGAGMRFGQAMAEIVRI